MKISHTHIYTFSIPMHPFTIATGTMHYAQNIFIRIFTDQGIYGVGECSAFPMIVGETQATCFEMARDFAALWKLKDPLNIPERMGELHAFTAYNGTVKSAFDMALYDISAKAANMPLYAFLGGERKRMETDITIGINNPQVMVDQAISFRNNGARILKVKLGSNPEEDVERIRQIRYAVGDDIKIRIDANQGWTYVAARSVLTEISRYNIEFCEQPMRRYNDHLLPVLHRFSPIPIMADESVFDHHDAERILNTKSCSFVNIKFAKSGGILEALKINEVCCSHHVPCMMGGMLESRVALTAFAHFASATDNIQFYDMDTCMLGHKLDPVIGGVSYNGYFVELPEAIGIGADADDAFLSTNKSIIV
ncbi:MAG TPA: dipeptide epimerase [Agriterribacter sp.]|nr:dipeptide epimerase [Chitinophagaceae bacterium]HRP30977.1 dipeptide epimerase [Agriterribacter sp.]